MVIYSDMHGELYDTMIREMLQFAGFQESVNQRLRRIAQPSAKEARWVDDLYGIYADGQVIEDD